MTRRPFRARSLVALVTYVAALAAILAIVALPAAARADGDAAPEALFRRGAEALQRGEYGAAIDAFEALADRGFESPDASYDRGLAYVQRVRAKADRPGDLGRAAAAFQEALLLRPGDHDADAALDLVRAEVTRRRSRKSKDAVDVRPTLDRVIIRLASEETWGIAAFVASLLLAAGLVLRARPVTAAPHSGAAHVAGSVLAPTALVALVVLAPLTWAARDLRLNTRPAVVIASEAHLTDDAGQKLPGDPIAEAANVEAGERKGNLVRVRWGATVGWLPAASVRLLRRF